MSSEANKRLARRAMGASIAVVPLRKSKRLGERTNTAKAIISLIFKVSKSRSK
ncbi:hypothetical protein THIOM_002842 [Candidatus Thiomargarita nelsonii]|uniref:Uncharacterized protein n=1 Tax=Candidatus Thiomargarita nelsonii TaxID=1003181 RepID=A0A176RZZ9_9GAMM|nr:hypothetical protein THIOM_002842 [Candidatus Thiomargarita nelsonii]